MKAPPIRVGIFGYGNVAKGVEKAIAAAEDISLEAVFTRRDPSKVVTVSGVKAVPADRVLDYKDKIDVMLMCGGSATDLPVQGPEMAKHFNIVDTFDTHAKIPEYLAAVGGQAVRNKKVAVVSVGWDPGLFSMMKSLFSSLLPDGMNQAFWGPGVSQGHSDAVRHINGVKNAIQYTVPVESVLADVRNGSVEGYETREKHRRVCYVVAEKDADKARITKEIKEMPYYFSDYDTEVRFVSSEELETDHAKMAHGGHVFRNGATGKDERYAMEFSMRFDSNPAFTGSILLAVARAAFRLYREKSYGARTVLDIPLSDLSGKDRNEQIREFL
jgi:diaminopimelate dehydrogenase